MLFPNWLHLAKPTCHSLHKQEVLHYLPKNRVGILKDFNAERGSQYSKRFLIRNEKKNETSIFSTLVAVKEGDCKELWTYTLLQGKIKLLNERKNERRTDGRTDKPTDRPTENKERTFDLCRFPNVQKFACLMPNKQLFLPDNLLCPGSQHTTFHLCRLSPHFSCFVGMLCD